MLWRSNQASLKSLLSRFYSNKPKKPVNYYEVLGVPPDASLEQIKAKYRELAFQFHPDHYFHRNKDKKHNKNDPKEMFAKVRRAYEVLSNEEVRRAYDKTFNFEEHANFNQTPEDIQRKLMADRLSFLKKMKEEAKFREMTGEKDPDKVSKNAATLFALAAFGIIFGSLLYSFNSVVEEMLRGAKITEKSIPHKKGYLSWEDMDMHIEAERKLRDDTYVNHYKEDEK